MVMRTLFLGLYPKRQPERILYILFDAILQGTETRYPIGGLLCVYLAVRQDISFIRIAFAGYHMNAQRNSTVCGHACPFLALRYLCSVTSVRRSAAHHRLGARQFNPAPCAAH